MQQSSELMNGHRVSATDNGALLAGDVRWSWRKSLWFTGMAMGTLVGGSLTATWASITLFGALTASVLLFGHSLGSHRKLIHDSFQCPKWLEYLLVYMGVQVGLAGPFGLLRQHDLRDYAQRLPECHSYLRHGESFWRDCWWQIHCDLHLTRAPELRLEERVAHDGFYKFIECTWMLQQLPLAAVLFVVGGWAFVWWGVCARVTTCILGHWLIGHFAHNHGEMSYAVEGAAVQGRNIRFTSLLTMGECWHNNHHAFPGSARLGLYSGEWDPGWWTLRGLQHLGLVWNMRLPEDLPARPQLVALRASRSSLCVDRDWYLDGPARWLPEPWLQRLSCGRFILTDGPRMTLHVGERSIHGMRALVMCRWLSQSTIHA